MEDSARARGGRCQEWYGRPARQFVSYREILDLKDVDAVMIASCDHHHAIHLAAAAQAKKDAYCEKPLAMDMESLKRCCDAVKQNGIVAQMGTQVRSFATSTGCRDLFRSGQIGKVSRIEQRRNGTKPYWYSWMENAEPIREEDVDWKEFLMDRPMRPFDGKLLTGWYGYREFSDGPIANLGCHFIDLYNYIVGTTLPVSCVAQGGTFTWKDENGFTCPDHAEATWIYPEGFMVSYTTNFGNGDGNVMKIYGDQGVIDLTSWDDPDLFQRRRDQAQQASPGGNARSRGGNARPFPQLAPVPAHPRGDQRADRGRLSPLRAGADGHARHGHRPPTNLRRRNAGNPRRLREPLLEIKDIQAVIVATNKRGGLPGLRAQPRETSGRCRGRPLRGHLRPPHQHRLEVRPQDPLGCRARGG